MLKLAVIAAFALVGAPTTAATIVTNGYFNDLTNFVVNDPSGGMQLVSGSTALTGWTIKGEVLWIGPAGADPSGPLRGLGLTECETLRSDADAILQVIDDLPEILTFEAITTTYDDRNNRPKIGDELDILVDGQKQTGWSIDPTSIDGVERIRFTFRHSGPRAVLEIRGRGSSSSSYAAISEVQVSSAVVPEPASWTIMVLGFGLVGSTLRARPRRLTA